MSPKTLSLRRSVGRLLLLALLGGLTTVAVAWSCVLQINVTPQQGAEGITAAAADGDGYRRWSVTRDRADGALRIVSSWRTDPEAARLERTETRPEDLVPPWARSLHPVDGSRPGTRQVRLVDARGWPWLAMWSAFAEGASPYRAIGPERSAREVERHWEEVRHAIRLSPRAGWSETDRVDVRLLPLAPLWPGFLLDSLVFALLWLLGYGLLRLARATVRLMTRRAAIASAVSCLFLGALTTIAVAWSLAAWVETYHYDLDRAVAVHSHGQGYAMWQLTRLEGRGLTRIDSRWWRDTISGRPRRESASVEDDLPRWAGYARPVDDQPDRSLRIRVIQALGWPLRALWSGHEVFFDPTAAPAVGGIESSVHGIDLEPPPAGGDLLMEGTRTLPLGPIWLGLGVDTVVYALLWFGVLTLGASPLLLRRAWRHRRGRCPLCGYDLQGSSHPRCPECGGSLAG